MPITTPDIVIVSVSTAIFSLLLIPTALRLRSRERVVSHLFLFILVSLALNVAFLSERFRLLAFSADSYEVIARVAFVGLTLTFGALTLDFLRKAGRQLLIYWLIALSILAGLSYIALNMGGAGGLAQQSGDSSTTLLMLSIVGWVVGIGTALLTVTLDFRKPHPTQYLNRLRYWVIATTLMVVIGVIFFFSPHIFGWAGVLVLAVAGILASYIVLSYHTPDLRLLIGRALQYAGLTTILFTLYFVSLAVMLIISRHPLYSNNTLFWTFLIALILANISRPIWQLARQFLTRLLFGQEEKDTKQIIRRYSRSISSALDMNRLGDTIINLMIETLGIEHGIVFTNQRGGMGNIILRPLSSVGMPNLELTTGHFMTESPFINYFRQGKKILSQYDIDVLPEFKALPKEEKAWLSALNIEFFIGILRERELIGLLAFGQQGKKTAYYDEDRELMMALADQAALAMDSARLFEQLAVINQEVGELTNQLAGLDQGKADFLSIASHELRTPLTHIHGYSRMLLDLTEEELSDPNYVKTIIEGIAKGSERMKGVIDLMFDVTEVDVGEMNLFTGPVDLAEVIDMATRPFLAALDERRIAFGKSGFETLPIVEADGTRLVQAFENLIGNAIKYTPDGGIVTIEGKVVERDDIGAGVEIAVIDTGIGIDPDHHKTIFEKFFRVDDTEHHSTGKTKFKGAGPGLGLTLVKGIAEAHGGRVWVDSLGHDEVNLPGSKFFFVIPAVAVIRTKSPKQSQIETRHWKNRDLTPETEE